MEQMQTLRFNDSTLPYLLTRFWAAVMPHLILLLFYFLPLFLLVLFCYFLQQDYKKGKRKRNGLHSSYWQNKYITAMHDQTAVREKDGMSEGERKKCECIHVCVCVSE